jgi:ABC-type amino acid transport substrate-binding protein/signal transduction histidine kinase
MKSSKIIIKLTLLFYLFVSSSYGTTNEKVIAVVPKYFPPQYSLDKNNKPKGFAIDILNAIAKNLDFEVEYIIKDSWPEVNNFLIQNHADIIPNMGISKKREKYFLFTAAVESFNIGIYARKSNGDIFSHADLKGKKIGVVEFNIGIKLSGQFTQSEVIVYKTKEEVFYALLSTEIDAVIYPIPVFNKMIADAKIEDSIIQIGQPLKEIKRAIAVNKNKPELYKKINLEVNKLIKTKEYETLYSKWYGKDKQSWSKQKVINAFMILVVVFIIILFVNKYYLTKRLNQELEEELDKRTKEIIQKDELVISQARQAATGEILEMISHQWRQPLAIIQMAMNNIMADMQLGEEITYNKLNKIVDSVTKQTATLSTTIDKFSSFSSLQTTKQNIPILKIREEIESIIKADFNKNGIGLEFYSDYDGSILIYKNELIQVILSIMQNAKETLLARQIANGMIKMKFSKKEESLDISICDNAGGILEDNIDKIAKPYYSTKSLNSAGLGLYISNIIVKKHLNAELNWENKDNGACFTIRLPKPKKLMNNKL